jgi:hypothetical protein
MFEFFKLVKIVTIKMLGSEEDQHTFSTISFMKPKLHNLHVVVGMYSQTFFTFNNFPYDGIFDD